MCPKNGARDAGHANEPAHKQVSIRPDAPQPIRICRLKGSVVHSSEPGVSICYLATKELDAGSFRCQTMRIKINPIIADRQIFES
jgi:hypothetical protein